MKKQIIAFTFAAVAAFASVSGAQPQRTNYDVFKDVSNQVTRYVNFTVFDNVAASVENGTVTLTGRVTMPYKKDDLERRVSKVNGVSQIDNKIAVLPVSIFDDELRFRIARAIYSNPALQMYANRVNPPIHVIVEHGRVTLEGVVLSNMDRVVARSIASNFLAFDVKNELKTEAEAKAELEKI